MSQSKIIFSAVKILLFGLMCFSVSFAQAQDNQKVEPSFDVILQTITASNSSTEKSAPSPALVNVVKKLKLNYQLSNYDLSSTYIQRVANTGNIDFKSVSNQGNQDVSAPIFVDWNFGQLITLPDIQGKNSIQIKNFRFGQRVPVKNMNGTEPTTISYESIGLAMQKLNISENTPTVIGSLTTSKPDEIMFLILTVKSAEN